MFKHISSSWIKWHSTAIRPLKRVHSALGPGQGLEYYSMDAVSTRALTACLPTELQPHARVYWAAMQGPFAVNPHRDLGTLSVINWYTQPAAAVTRFYQTTAHTRSITHWQGHPVAHGYDPSTLETVGEFTAQAGDCYVLNVEHIHDVSVKQERRREFVTWNFPELSWEQVQCCFD